MVCCAMVRVVCNVLLPVMRLVWLFAVVLRTCGGGVLVSWWMLLSVVGVRVVADLLEEI